MAYLGNDAIEIKPVETESIGSLGTLILAELPNCDDLLVRQQLGYALREFCRETNACVIEAPSEAEADPYGAHFPLPPAPQGMMLGTVLDVHFDGRSVAFEVRDLPWPHVVVKCCANEGDKAIIRFSVYPKVGGENCPGWFKERYAEAIVAGAMDHLLSMSKRAWSDPQRAVEYGAKYADAIAEASYRSLGSAMQGGAESAIPCGGLFM